jgi:hypothetical protein
MNCKIHIYLLNDLYSQAFADENHNGQESADNIRFEWEDELEINQGVTTVEEINSGTYQLVGIDENDTEFSYEIADMHLFKITTTAELSTYVGASKSIIDHCQYECAQSTHRIHIFLKDYEPMANPVPGIFIASKSFPKALIR